MLYAVRVRLYPNAAQRGFLRERLAAVAGCTTMRWRTVRQYMRLVRHARLHTT